MRSKSCSKSKKLRPAKTVLAALLTLCSLSATVNAAEIPEWSPPKLQVELTPEVCAPEATCNEIAAHLLYLHLEMPEIWAQAFADYAAQRDLEELARLEQYEQRCKESQPSRLDKLRSRLGWFGFGVLTTAAILGVSYAYAQISHH